MHKDINDLKIETIIASDVFDTHGRRKATVDMYFLGLAFVGKIKRATRGEIM